MKAHKAIMREGVSTEASFALNICELLTARGWEQNPTLYMMLDRTSSGTPGMAQIPVLDIAWAMAGDPLTVIHALTETIGGDVQKTTARARITAVALAYEGWALIAEDDETKAAEYDAWQQAGNSPADHPDGIELRGVFLVTTKGESVYVEQLRGRPATVRHDLDDSHVLIEGAYPQALGKLLSAMTTL